MTVSNTLIESQNNKKKCGIIMPISDTDNYPNGHWSEVLNILKDAISETNFESSLVSQDDAVGLIHKRIVQNIRNNEMIVCDVSSKNPNVMFELGLRLSLCKPTVIIKDDQTNYSFDINGIEHLTYSKSLRFPDISKFKKELTNRITATYQRFQTDGSFSTFFTNIDPFSSDYENLKLNDPNFQIIDPNIYEIIHWHIANKTSINYSDFEKIRDDFRDRSKPIQSNRLKEIIQYYFNKAVEEDINLNL